MLLFFIHLILKFNYIHVSRKQKWLLTMFVLERGGGKGGGEEGGREGGGRGEVLISGITFVPTGP